MNLFSKEVDWNDTKFLQKVGSFHQLIRDEDTFIRDKEKSHVEICTPKYVSTDHQGILSKTSGLATGSLTSQHVVMKDLDIFGYTDILMNVWEKTMENGSQETFNE